MKNPLSALLIFVSISSFAQNQGGNVGHILLLNHTLTVESGNLHELAYDQNEVVSGKIYRIIYGENLRLGSEYPGFTTLEYLPKDAFISAIKVDQITAVSDFLNSKNASVIAIKPEYKLSSRLFSNDIPEWARINGNQIKVWVQYYPGLHHSQMRMALINQGYEIIDENTGNGLISVAIDPREALNLAALPFVLHVQEMEDPGSPENYTARTDHRVNYLQAKYAGAPGYDGTGITVGHGDDGAIGNHIDYKGRLLQSAGNSQGDHGDHVAGTIFGAGNLDPKGQGMAPGAEIYYQSYPNNLHDADLNYTVHDVLITSSSYSNGCNAGYTNFTKQLDQDAIDNPSMLHVFSSGNNGNSSCGYGTSGTNGGVNGWGNITGGHKIAKNVIAVGNLSRTDVIAGSSSRGPARDGRIKPDVTAVGSSVYSTTDLPTENSYAYKTGTSMACPGVSGTLATLYEAYTDTYTANPHGGLMKAILLNTAEDLGNPGPDYIYGYGRINARRAARVIESGDFMTDTLVSGNKSFNIPVPSGTVKEVRIMLYWPDVPASTSSSRALVNDLDITVSQGASTYQPWVLDPTANTTALNSDAVRARDSLNNMEQVTFSNPGSGNITVSVDGFNMVTVSQQFFITYEFVMEEIVVTYPAGGEGLVPGEQEIIRWDANAGSGDFILEYSVDNGSSWNVISNTINSNIRHYTWNVPAAAADSAKIRVSQGSLSSQSPGTFSIIGVPSNVHFFSSCPDSAKLQWSPVSNATGYIVYRLGPKYMDSIAYVSTNSITMGGNNPTNSEWYSVAAVINAATGRRAIAIQKPKGVFNCAFSSDLAVVELLSPPPGLISDCFDFSNSPLMLSLENNGTNDLYNFDLHYTINSGSVVTDHISDTIPSGAKLTYTFINGTLSLLGIGNYNIDVWVTFNIDENRYNDTLHEIVSILPGNMVNAPYYQDFENFINCDTDANCSVEDCNLSNGWSNAANGMIDDIDWRVNSGVTPSQNTGPDSDHNPGIFGGKYLYTEASGGCNAMMASVITPCLDLSDASMSQPQAQFWFHMFGIDMGILMVDIIMEDKTIKNVFPAVFGNKGNLWRPATVDLTPYLAEKVILKIKSITGNGPYSDLAIDDFSFTDGKMGVEETALPQASLYPNPHSGKFEVALGGNIHGKVAFAVSDMSGKCLYRMRFHADGQTSFNLDISHMPDGVYILTVKTSDTIQNLNMIKK